MRIRHAAAVVIAATAASLLMEAPALDWLRGLSTDTVFWLRHQAFGPRHGPADSPVAVVAIDEETYRRLPFRDLPKVTWTRQLAGVMRAVLAGGARVVGYDVIFPTSIERFVPGFDRDYLIALHEAAEAGKVVLGKVQHQVKPISPFAGYSFAVGHQRNIRAVNVIEDPDGVVRRMPLWLLTSDLRRGVRRDPSMALELAARWLGTRPEIDDDGVVRLDGARVPAAGDTGALINFVGGSGAIPTYSLADLYACAEAGDAAYFRRHFADRVVLIGAVLDVEDRKLTSERFITGPEGVNLPPRCRLPVMHGLYRTDLHRDTIPGVEVLAASVSDLIRGETVREIGAAGERAVRLALALLAGAAVLALSPIAGAAALAGGALAWTAVATVALREAVLLPWLDPLLAAALAATVLYGYRFAVADRDKIFLRRAFSLYLPEAEVERLAASARPPALGGEVRELTVLFSDVEGFTAVSERLPPEELVGLLNNYLSEVTGIIEAHGGFIDKFIGDGVVAVFGAPLPDPAHARHAVEAALAIHRRMNAAGAGPDGPTLTTRVGVNSGPMLVGNIGSRRRFNYTVLGDAVNLAARLEGANKAYGTRVLASGRTRDLCAGAVVFREIDTVRVVGRSEPVVLCEPLATRDELGEEERSRLARFEDARAALRAGAFEDAARLFGALSDGDAAAAALAARASELASRPPSEWDGVTDLQQK